MSNVSDLEFVHSDVHRNGTLLDSSGTATMEIEPQSNSSVAKGADMEIEAKAVTNLESFCEEGISSNIDVPGSIVETLKSTKNDALEEANNVSGAESTCSSTAAEDRLNFLIDSLPVATPSRVDESNGDIVDDTGKDGYDCPKSVLPVVDLLKRHHKTHAPRETSRATLLSMGPYAIYCDKHYASRPHMAINRRRTSPPTGDVVDDSSVVLIDPSGSTFVPAADVETIAQPRESKAFLEHTSSPPNRLYISRTRQQLEDATKNWFTRENRIVASAAESGSSYPQPKESIDLFSLKYNEATVSTIAAWVAGGPTRKRVTPTFLRPIVDTRFRSCNVCGMYGHYEVECQSLTPDLMIKLSRVISGEASLTNEYGTMKIKKHDYDVMIEVCDGFFIEQQSSDKVDAVQKYIKDVHNVFETPAQGTQCTSKDRLENQIEIDCFWIREGPAGELPSNPESPVLPIPEPLRALIQVGSLVTWFVKERSDNNTFVPETILAGTVAKIEADLGRVQVKVLRVIFAESKSVENYGVSAETYGSLGVLVWVCASSLYLVDEQNQVLQSSNSFSDFSKKVKKSAAVKRSRILKVEKSIKKHRRVGRPKLHQDSLSKNTKRGRKPSKCKCFDV
jgi:hypothetical protein